MGGIIIFKEWLLSKILGKRILFFKDKNGEFELINNIEFSDDTIILYFKDKKG